MISVLLVEDHPVVRQGIAALLEAEDDMVLVAQCATAAELQQCMAATSASVLILDLALPDAMGMDVLHEVVEAYPHVHVLVHSAYSERDYALRALRAGAKGYLCKSAPPEELPRAIRALHKGERYITPELASLLAECAMHDNRLPHERLSDREFMVLLELARGRTVGEIAVAENLSPKTISTYRTRVLEKTGLSNNADLVAYVSGHGLLSPGGGKADEDSGTFSEP